jgi:hypothetical protein
MLYPSHFPKTVFTINPLQYSTKTEKKHDIMDVQLIVHKENIYKLQLYAVHSVL